MRIFFDVDFTLIAGDGSLRPLVKETFQKLKAERHTIYVWSGVGIRWEVVRQHGLRELIETCFLKPLENHRENLAKLGVSVLPDFCVDDYQEIIDAFGGYTIQPYYVGNQADREMVRVYEEIQAHINGNRRA